MGKHFSIRRTFRLATALALALAALPGCSAETFDSESTLDSAATSAEEPVAELEQGLGCFSSLPSVLTGTSPFVTRSGAFSSSYEAWKAFDSNTSGGSMWISALRQTPAWVAYEWTDGPRTVMSYAITFANGSLTTRAPKNWTFEGWNGSAWVVLDTRTNQTGWLGFQRRSYDLNTPGTYNKYRINISEDNDARTGIEVVSMSNLELIGCTPGATPLWTRFHGAPGGFTQSTDLAGDPAARTYATGLTTVPVDAQPMVGVMDAYVRGTDWGGGKIWTKHIGSPGQITAGYGVARNSTFEEIYVAGFTAGSINGNAYTAGGGRYDLFLTKIRYTGTVHWTRQFGVGGADTEAYGVAVDNSNNAYVVGATQGNLAGSGRVGSSDGFVVKFDANGTRLWVQQFGSAGVITHARRAASDAAGNVYVAGWTVGSLHGEPKVGNQDYFVVKFDASGARQWTRQLGVPGGDAWLYGAAFDAGRLYLTGYSPAGLDGQPAGTGHKAYLVQYDELGNRLWTRQFGSGAGAWGRAVFANSWWATGIWVAGSGVGNLENPNDTSTGKAHPYVAKFDTLGNRLYINQLPTARTAGVERDIYAQGVVLDDKQNAYLAGYTGGDWGGVKVQGSPDAFVTKIPKP